MSTLTRSVIGHVGRCEWHSAINDRFRQLSSCKFDVERHKNQVNMIASKCRFLLPEQRCACGTDESSSVATWLLMVAKAFIQEENVASKQPIRIGFESNVVFLLGLFHSFHRDDYVAAEFFSQWRHFTRWMQFQFWSDSLLQVVSHVHRR